MIRSKFYKANVGNNDVKFSARVHRARRELGDARARRAEERAGIQSANNAKDELRAALLRGISQDFENFD